jgi:urease accessory protein
VLSVLPLTAQAEEASKGPVPASYGTRAEAEKAAKLSHCTGAHQMGDKWMPCAMPPDLHPKTKANGLTPGGTPTHSGTTVLANVHPSMKRFFPLLFLTALVAMALGTLPVEAHGTAAGGALDGAAHPLLGLDHLLMLLAVGTAASQISLVLLPAALGGGVLGAVVGSVGPSLPLLETLAALAIMAVAALSFQGGGRWSTHRAFEVLSAAVVGAGVAIHGLLHGLEAPAGAAGPLWWAGALLSSAVVCGGTALVLRLLPRGWGRAVALALLMAGGLQMVAVGISAG